MSWPRRCAVEAAASELGAEGFSQDDSVAKISVVGLGMATQTGVARRMFRALADAGVNMQMITTSEIKISALVGRDQANTALRAVHRAFELEKRRPRPRRPGQSLVRCAAMRPTRSLPD